VDLNPNHRPRPYQGHLWCYMHSIMGMSPVSCSSGTKLATGTAQTRIKVANPGDLSRIEMYVDVEFTSPSGVGQTASIGLFQ
jgi:hypothetical protein